MYKRQLKNYSWPGNVAELENMIRTAVADSTGSILQINSDNLAKFGGTGSKPVRHESLSDYNAWMETAEATIDILINKARYLEKEPGKQGLLPEMEALIIRKTMQLFEGNISKTAELLGISQTSLQIKLKTIGLGPIKESS